MQIYQTEILKTFLNLTSAFTTRTDGNVAFHVGEDVESVNAKHTALAQKLHYKRDTLVHMKQLHSRRVKVVSKKDNYKNPPSCDALITNQKKMPLMVMVADCSPILFYDETQKVIAVAHAGRTGAFNNIVQVVIDSFKNNFHSKPKNIYVSVGASIKVCCYEIGEEIAKEAEILHLGYAIEMKNQKYFLNISKILEKQLLAAGLTKEHIEISQECTCCLKEKYFSYRAKKETGRFAGVICMH